MDYDIGRAFEQIENELLESIVRNLKRHKAEETELGFEWEQWQVTQLKELQRFKQRNKDQYSIRFRDMNAKVRDVLANAHIQGMSDEEKTILEAIKNGFVLYTHNPGLNASFFRINERKITALMNAVEHDLKVAQHAVLRYADDQYRRIIYSSQVAANTGAITYEKAVDMATKDFLNRGINCIQYSNGARINIASYADMAIRTASKRAYLMGEGVKRQEWGITTVILNKRTNACPLCMPFEGKVLIDDVWSDGSKNDGPYPLMSSAMAAGLYHPNCKDKHTTYFPRLDSESEHTFTKQELEDIKERQRLENKLGYTERQVNKFNRLAKFSLDKENIENYTRKKNNYLELVYQAEEALDKFESEKRYILEDRFESDVKRYKRRRRFPHLTKNDRINKEVYKQKKKEYMVQVLHSFKNGTELGRRILLKYADLSIIATLSESGVIRYEQGKIHLNMFYSLEDDRGTATSYFHEFGHHIDDVNGFKFTNDKNLFILLKQDYSKVDKQIIEEIYSNPKASSTSDLIHGLSGGTIQGNYFHSLKYWESKINFQSEFFAHVFEAQFDMERRSMLEKAFPTAYNYVIEKLKRM